MRETNSTSPLLGGLGRRILAALLVVSLVPLVLSAVVAQWRSTALLEGYLAENAGKTARAYAGDLDLFLERQRDLLRHIDVDGDASDTRLAAQATADPNIDALILLSADGAPVALSDNAVDTWAIDACQRLVDGPASAVTHSGAGHAHHVVVGVPRGDGILCGQVSFTLHQDLLTERAGSVAGGTAWIVDRSGTVVCHSFEDDEPNVGRGDQLGPKVADVAARAQPWSGMRNGPSGQVVAAFAPASTLPWGVWVEIPRDVAAGPLRTWLVQLLMYAGGLAFLAGALALIFVRRLVSPVQDVVEAVRIVADGQYGAEVPVRGNDEIAELAREFNRMSVALEDSYTLLDARVKKRTRQLEDAHARLLQQEKMASLGTLAAGLAHEIGNPLASMSSELELLETMWDPEEARASLPVLRDQVRRMSKLLGELVEYGRQGDDDVSVFPPGPLLDDVERLLRHDPRGHDVTVVVSAAADLTCLCSNRDRLVQVLVNLGLNAFDALQGRGQLSFRALAHDTDTICIEVADDGPGMSPEVAAHIFDPFFTTKDPGKGTGLGLFVSERIVQGLGGRIEVHLPKQGGTSFRVLLPSCACEEPGVHSEQ